jgi:hypothetical protein
MLQVVQLAFQKLHYSREFRVQKSQNAVGELRSIHRHGQETKRLFFTLLLVENGKSFLFTYYFVILKPFIFDLDFQVR